MLTDIRYDLATKVIYFIHGPYKDKIAPLINEDVFSNVSVNLIRPLDRDERTLRIINRITKKDICQISEE